MVKSERELPEEAATGATDSTLPSSSPEWNFTSISRPKTKRAGTPFPERARKASKRSELEPVPGICRVRKKMSFEEAEMLLAGIYGEKKGSPEAGHVLAGKSTSTMAHMEEVVKRSSNTHEMEEDSREGALGAAPELTLSFHTMISQAGRETVAEVVSLARGSGSREQVGMECGRVDGTVPETPAAELTPTGREIQCRGVGDLAGGLLTVDGTSSHVKSTSGVDHMVAGGFLEFSACDSPKMDSSNQTFILHEYVYPNLGKGDNSSKEVHSHVNSTSLNLHEKGTTFSDMDSNFSDFVPYVSHSLLVNEFHKKSEGLGLGACDSPIVESSKPLFNVHGNVTSYLSEDKNSNGAHSHTPHPLVNDDKLTSTEGTPAEADLKSLSTAVPGGGTAALEDDGFSESKDGDTLRKGEAIISEPITFASGDCKVMGTAGSSEGIPSLSFSNEETQILADKIGHAIIGKFSHTIPSSQQIQKSLANIHFVGGLKWKFMNAKHILIQFRDVCDYGRMLNGPNGAPLWHIEHHPMRVFKWTPDFDTFFESPIAAVWCKVVGIPIHLYDQSALLAIGKLLGKPIHADHATINQTRLTFARICVEIDISTPPPEEIILNILGKDTKYKVVWDRIPLYCVECKHVGHLKEACLTLGKKSVQPTKDFNRVPQPRRSGFVPKATRREWRPKKATTDTHASKPDREAAVKERTEQETRVEKRGVDMTTSSNAPTVHQVQVDEDGFQLVTKRRKGKSTYPLHQAQEGAHKVNYLEKLLKGGNVATVSFGEANVEVIDPGGGSTILTY